MKMKTCEILNRNWASKIEKHPEPQKHIIVKINTSGILKITFVL
jgi:hypothetical protein